MCVCVYVCVCVCVCGMQEKSGDMWWNVFKTLYWHKVIQRCCNFTIATTNKQNKVIMLPFANTSVTLNDYLKPVCFLAKS